MVLGALAALLVVTLTAVPRALAGGQAGGHHGHGHHGHGHHGHGHHGH